MRIRELLRHSQERTNSSPWFTRLVIPLIRLLIPKLQQVKILPTIEDHQRLKAKDNPPTTLAELYRIDKLFDHNEQASGNFSEYMLLDGTALPLLIENLQAEINNLQSGEVSVVFVIGSPGSGKSELIRRIKQEIKTTVTDDEIETFTWEQYAEYYFRKTLQPKERGNPTFTPDQLIQANITIVNAFKEFIGKIRQTTKVLTVEFPTSSGNLKNMKNPNNPTDPMEWNGHVTGDIILFKTLVHKHYPGIQPWIIAAYPGPVIFFKDVSRQSGAPNRVVNVYHAKTHVAMEPYIKRDELKLPDYSVKLIGPDSIDHCFDNPMEKRSFLERYGKNLVRVIEYVCPNQVPLDQQLRYLALFARKVALSEARALFMIRLLKNMYKVPEGRRSVVMVSPQPEALGEDKAKIHNIFLESLYKPVENERIM